ncbi:MAG: NAD(P)/FAD-dependent oxidoreductase [Bacilli bacterium]
MYDVIIVGGGVSGIACALNINKNLNSLLIESNDVIGKKLSITGNGRCNITNSNVKHNFLDNIYNYKFMYSAFNNFDNFDFINVLNSYGIKLKEEDNGRMFPTSNTSLSIINAFKENLNHIKINLKEKVLNINNCKNEFIITTSKGKYQTKKLVIATGGLSYPHTGSDGFGLKYARSTDHCITKLLASEAPLYSNNLICKKLQGRTFDNCTIKYNKKKIGNNSLLITHFGLSGPLAFRACFDIIKSNIYSINIDFISDTAYNELKIKLLESSNIKSTLNQYMTKSLTNYLLAYQNIKVKRFNELSLKKQEQLLTTIKNYPLELTKYADISKGFTTGGGIELSQINNSTFESKIIQNLYFIGEVLDIHAHTGGYNITTYFSMGVNCGRNI